MYCKNCGKLLEDDATFCTECGAVLQDEFEKEEENKGIKKYGKKLLDSIIKHNFIYMNLLYFLDVCSIVISAKSKLIGEGFSFVNLITLVLSVIVLAATVLLGYQGSNCIKQKRENAIYPKFKTRILPMVCFGIGHIYIMKSLSYLTFGHFVIALIAFAVGLVISFGKCANQEMNVAETVDCITEEMAIAAAAMVWVVGLLFAGIIAVAVVQFVITFVISMVMLIGMLSASPYDDRYYWR